MFLSVIVFYASIQLNYSLQLIQFYSKTFKIGVYYYESYEQQQSLFLKIVNDELSGKQQRYLRYLQLP